MHTYLQHTPQTCVVPPHRNRALHPIRSGCGDNVEIYNSAVHNVLQYILVSSSISAVITNYIQSGLWRYEDQKLHLIIICLFISISLKKRLM